MVVVGMFYFMEVINSDQQGNPRLGRNPDVAYVIDPEEKGEGQPPLLRPPANVSWEVYARHGETAWYLLDEPVNSMGHLADRLAGAPEMFRSVGILDWPPSLRRPSYSPIEVRRPGRRSESTTAWWSRPPAQCSDNYI